MARATGIQRFKVSSSYEKQQKEKSMNIENAAPSREEAEQLLAKMLVELQLMNGTRAYLEHRLKRQEDFLTRVGFENAKPARRERIMNRAAAAKHELTALLAEIHSFEDRIASLRRDLAV